MSTSHQCEFRGPNLMFGLRVEQKESCDAVLTREITGDARHFFGTYQMHSKI